MMDVLSSVDITAFGWLFLPMGVALLAWRPLWLLALLVVSAVFQAPAVITVALGGAGFGITPFNVACALIALHLCKLIAVEGWTTSNPQRPRCVYLLWTAFLAVSAIGALVLPRVFDGVPVHPALVRGITQIAPEPNRWSISHLAQAINCVALWVLFAYVHRLPDLKRALGVFFAGLICALVCSLLAGLHQRLAMSGVVPLYGEFWGSNPGYNQWYFAPEYGPRSYARVGLPFVEPSYAGVWFASVMCGAAAVALYGRSFRGASLLVLLMASLGLLNTMGTSGLAAAILGIGLLLIFHVLHGHRLVSSRVSLLLGVSLAACVLMAAVVAWDYTTLRIDALAAVRETIDWTWGKVTAYRGSERDLTNWHALQILRDTYGMGAGAGSTRASSYFMSLVANTGVVGLLLFMIALGSQTWRVMQVVDPGNVSAIAMLGALAGLLLGIGSGIPDQNWPVVWVILLGVFLVAEREAQ